MKMGKRVKDAAAVFNKIYDSTTTAALRFITSKCGSIDDVGDILQETYMEVYSVLCSKGTGFIENEEAFVINIAKKKVYKHYSRQNPNSAIPISVLTNENGEINLDLQPDEMDIDDSICTNELIEEVHNFLSEKPKDIQQIFFMRFSLELSISEIAKLLDSKESGIKNKLYRTINEIRQFYREKGDNI